MDRISNLRDYEYERNKKNVHDASFIIENLLGQMTFVKGKKRKSLFDPTSILLFIEHRMIEEFFIIKEKVLE